MVSNKNGLPASTSIVAKRARIGTSTAAGPIGGQNVSTKFK
jgi:hypothetical protein